MAFRFKQFSVEDEHASMKVGTDAVLLGAWAGNGRPEHILDIGAGSGVISLMLAQRFPGAMITGIDIHQDSVVQAEKNFNKSPWKKNLDVIASSLQDFCGGQIRKYELILSNPPFFSDSFRPHTSSKKVAKHTDSLSYEELVRGAAGLLHQEGSFALVLPYDKREKIAQLATDHGLFLARELSIIPIQGKDPNRYLSEWTLVEQEPVEDELCIRMTAKEYSREYKSLTEEFYLAL